MVSIRSSKHKHHHAQESSGKSLDKKLIKKDLIPLVQKHKINEAINYLKDVESSYLNFAYKILLNQIPKVIKLKSKKEKYLSQAQDLYNSLRSK